MICKKCKEWLKTIQEGRVCAKDHHLDIQIIEVLHQVTDLLVVRVRVKAHLQGIHRDRDQAPSLDNLALKDRDLQDLLQEPAIYSEAVVNDESFSISMS